MNKAELTSFRNRLSADLIREVTQAGDMLAESMPSIEGGTPRPMNPNDRMAIFIQSIDIIREVDALAFLAARLSDELKYRLDATIVAGNVISGDLRIGPAKTSLKSRSLKKPVVFNFKSKGTYTVTPRKISNAA